MAGVGTNTSGNPLKDSMGRYRTRSLFYEYRDEQYPAFWTLGDFDIEREGKSYPSLRLIYMSYPHIPNHEYEFAQELFGSWAHWQRLLVSNLKPIFIEWQEELEIKNKAQEIKNLIISSKGGDTAASRYLADRKWEGTKRGRPSKEEIIRNGKVDARLKQDLADDEERILSLVGRKLK